MPLQYKVQVRGEPFGHCNICGSFGKLTEDHVPPRSTQVVAQVDLYRIIDLLAVDKPIGKRRSRHMQSGVHYRSLCATCNNSLLGARYDPELMRFANSTTSVLRASLLMPDRVRIGVKPGFIARSVLGHLLAVGIERTERTPLLDSVRLFVQDDSLRLPAGIEIHFWLYPYRRQVAIRDASLVLDFFKTSVVFWCLKFFPLGFLVTWENEHPHRIDLPRLGEYMLNAGTHEAELLLPLVNLPHQFWPEAPGYGGAVLYGDGAHGAVPHTAA